MEIPRKEEYWRVHVDVELDWERVRRWSTITAGRRRGSWNATANCRWGIQVLKNLLVEGGQPLSALKALLPRYRGQIKCIYIDPPYNTGNAGWVYNDNVNDPRIRKWLGDVVG